MVSKIEKLNKMNVALNADVDDSYIFDIIVNKTIELEYGKINVEIGFNRYSSNDISHMIYNSNDEFVSFYYHSSKTLQELLDLNEKNKPFVDFCLSRLNYDLFEKYKEERNEVQRNFEEIVQKTFDQLKLGAQNANNKRLLKEIETIDKLSYCDARVLLDKIWSRLEKRNSAISILTYQELQRIRDEKIIECSY